MAEKKENGGEKKGKGGEEGKKNNNPNAIVLKIDMHCEGCASKIIKCAKSFKGVETAKVEWEASKLTVEGKVDPTKLRERLQEKTKKKVELVSPQQPKKDNKENNNKDSNKENNKDSNNATNNNSSNNGKNDSSSKGQGKKADDKKPKELPVTTVVLKLGLHCQGCVQKIHKFVSKTPGVKTVTIEREKDLVTVMGAIDAEALVEGLKARMKRAVEIVPSKKEKEKGKDNEEKKEGQGNGNGNCNGEGGWNQKEGGGNGNNNGHGNGNAGKKKKGGGGGGNGGNAGGNNDEENGMMGKMEGSRMEYYGIVGYPANTGFGYGYGYNGYHGYMYGENVHAPQYFSDENPNACSVM